MPNNLGRDKIWTPEVWTEIDNAVKEQWKTRVGQTVIKTVPMEGAADVAVERIDLNTDVIPEGQRLPFVEISREFSLTQSQVDNEATLRNGRDFARVAARLVAMGEDAAIFRGEQGFNDLVQRVQGQQAQRPLLRATNLATLQNGLLGIAPNAVQVPQIAAAQPANPPAQPAGKGAGAAAPAVAPVAEPVYRENTVNAVLRGLAILRQAGQPGPYALFLSPQTYADAYSPLPDTLQTPADRLLSVLKGGLQMANELPDNRGLLVSSGGDPVSICIAQDIAVAFNQQDPEGNYRFRAFERLQLNVREPSALVRMEFQ
jgi:uncharacterized linocin/CFP29 family protein